MLNRLIPAATRRLLAARLMPPGFASFSQSGEDKIIDFFLSTCGVQDATYIDAGCSHPIFGNNTYLLSRHGLRGICIDPTPGLADLYRKYRPRDTFLSCALVPGTEQEVTINFFAESTINTVSTAHADQYAGFGFEKGSATRVPATNLERVCRENGLAHLDVLCLDVEGLDFDIISGLDLRQIRPKLICVETVTYADDKTPAVDGRFANFLEENGYIKYADTRINQIFADEVVARRQRLI